MKDGPTDSMARRRGLRRLRFRGPAGEYVWEKEMERLERFKDRPWELQSRDAARNPLLFLLIVSVATAVGLAAFLLF